jgi:hypothetical protein
VIVPILLAALIDTTNPQDALPNATPVGCFATIAADWNAKLDASARTENDWLDFATRFHQCAAGEPDEVQKRSAYVGEYASETSLVIVELEKQDRFAAKVHFGKAYGVLGNMAKLASSAGDVDLGRWAQDKSIALAQFGYMEGLQDNEDSDA